LLKPHPLFDEDFLAIEGVTGIVQADHRASAEPTLAFSTYTKDSKSGIGYRNIPFVSKDIGRVFGKDSYIIEHNTSLRTFQLDSVSHEHRLPGRPRSDERNISGQSPQDHIVFFRNKDEKTVAQWTPRGLQR
jgi:hypothetical protein